MFVRSRRANEQASWTAGRRESESGQAGKRHSKSPFSGALVVLAAYDLVRNCGASRAEAYEEEKAHTQESSLHAVARANVCDSPHSSASTISSASSVSPGATGVYPTSARTFNTPTSLIPSSALSVFVNTIPANPSELIETSSPFGRV